MLKKIAIHIENDFSDDIWRLLFSLYDYCHGVTVLFGEEDFANLMTLSQSILYHEDIRPIDAIAPYGSVLDYNILKKELLNNTEFFISVVYVKNNTRIGDPNFLPLINRFSNRDIEIEYTDFSLGIDISELDEKSKNRFIYTIGQRISIVDKLPTPRASKRCIYYIDNYNGSKITKSFPYSLSHDAPGSRRSLLLPIDENSIEALFNPQKKIIDDYGQEMLIKSIKSFKNSISDYETSNFMEEWMVKAYFNTYSKKDETIKEHYNIDKDCLHEYSNNIYELVQNILFHTEEKTGWLSIRFYKKRDVPSDLRKKIPFYEKYSDEDRFLLFDLSDNGKKGIVETFGNDNLSLLSFVNPREILPDDCAHLSLRYAAHLGIKTFVSSVLNHHGYLYVESNNSGNRKDKIESQLGEIKEITDYVNEEDGTCYRVILPINQLATHPSDLAELSIGIERDDNTVESIKGVSVSKRPRFIPIQSGAPSINKDNNGLLTFQLVNPSLAQSGSRNVLFENKKEQEDFIKNKGDELISTISTIQGRNTGIGIDISKYEIPSANLFFKLIAYIRLNISAKKQPETIVCYNLTDGFFDELHSIIKNHNNAIAQKGQPIWSNDYAVVLMTSNRVEILCGESEDLFCFVNNGLSRYYYFEECELDKTNGKTIIDSKKIEKFIRPYDLFIGKPSLFESSINDVLNREIDDAEKKNSGCLVNIPARLGEKIYIENFFQADHIFQESYYAERFALYIARDYLKNIKDKEKQQRKNVIILSYNTYSKLLTEYIKTYLESTNEVGNSLQIHVTSIVTGVDDSESEGMRFEISGDYWFGNAISVITIVPIATTLTTFEKLNNNFQYFYHKKQPNGQLVFEYNHCSILVRDKARKRQTGCSKMESEWNWKRFYSNKKLVFTAAPQTIHFCVTVETFWHHLIDERAFPPSDKFYEEKFILRTHDSSLHVTNILGYPDVFIQQDILVAEKRLAELKNYILFGHIIHNDKHHRYYFDVPKYIEAYQNNARSELRKWISELRICIGQVNIVVTSEPDKDPQLTTFIKNHLFNNSAHILFMDLHDRNIQYKYSYLKLLKDTGCKVKYYFVDQALLTGNAYYSAKRQMSFILDEPNFKFDNIITIVNRLSKTKYEEILNDLTAETIAPNSDKNHSVLKCENKIYSFVQFLIPPSKVNNSNCYICDMESVFEELKKDSVITDCRSIIEQNRKKYCAKEYEKAKKEHDETRGIVSKGFNRFYKRMIWQNRLFYNISKALANKLNSQNREDVVDETIETLHVKSMSNIDDHISFIKAISTPPLSEYARIRKIALRLLLFDLEYVINKKRPGINDLFLLKVLLRHLALLESNALVRERVIVGSWETYNRIKEQLPMEIQQTMAAINELIPIQKTKGQVAFQFDDENRIKLYDIFEYIGFQGTLDDVLDERSLLDYINKENNKLNQFPNHLLFYIKIATHNDASKSLWLGELLRNGIEMKAGEFNNSFNVSRTKLYNCLFKREGIGTSNIILPYLFYENTTIIRKTLKSFNNDRHLIIYDDGQRNKTVNEGLIQELDNENPIERVKDIVKKSYSFNWFKLFFPTKKTIDKFGKIRELRDYAIEEDVSVEGIPLIEKYILLSRTRQFLDELSEDPKKNNIFTFEKNADKLIASFTSIMDAQAAYITIYPRPRKYYTLSIYYKSDDCYIPKEAITYNNTFYCTNLLDDYDNTSEEIGVNRSRPFVIRRRLEGSNNSFYGECFDSLFKRAAYLPLEYNGQTIGLITFLYKGQENGSNNLFLRKTQELGRLLLLLKPQIDQYVQVVAENKQFEEWVRNQHMARVSYAENHGLDLAGWDFDNLAEKDYLKIYNGIFMLSNVVIRNLYGKLMNEHEIKLNTERIVMSEMFDKKFTLLLKIISTNIFHAIDIKFDELSDENDVTIPGLKPVFQSYVIQLLKNAAKHADSSCFNIHFYMNYFEIENDIRRSPETIASMKELFEKKYNEKAMESFVAYPQDIDEYGFTLLSLFYYNKSIGMKSEFGFKTEDKPSFFVRIIYPQYN